MPEPASAVKQGLTRKVGPLPVYGWIGIAVVGGAVVYVVFLRPRSTESTLGGGALSRLMPTGTTPPSTSGGGGGGGGTQVVPGGVVTPPGFTFTPTPSPSPSVTTPAPRITQAAWLDNAIGAVTKSVGVSADVARLYLTQFLSGVSPRGNPSASSAFERVVRAAVQEVGRPPVEPSIGNVNVNPFASNASWWANARGYLPGVAGSVLQELTNLVNGTTTTISQQAADALEAARAILGSEPTGLSFSVLRPDENESPNVPTVSLDQVRGLWKAAQDRLAEGVPATQLNVPSNYLPIYRWAFPGLADEQLAALQQRVKDLIVNNQIDASSPDYGKVRDAINASIAAGERQAIPGG